MNVEKKYSSILRGEKICSYIFNSKREKKLTYVRERRDQESAISNSER